MTQYAIVTDLNKCVGCLACSVSCKVVNGVAVGNFWNRTLRIGPSPKKGGSGQYPDIEMYFLTVQCQHCENPECVSVCPTEASTKQSDGTVQIDKAKCIGCQFCVMACPYGVRYLNKTERVVEKCTLCEQRITEGFLPQCVAQCSARARFFGDLEQGIESFEGPASTEHAPKDASYNTCQETRTNIMELVEPFTDADVHELADVGNAPAFKYILRNIEWK